MQDCMYRLRALQIFHDDTNDGNSGFQNKKRTPFCIAHRQKRASENNLYQQTLHSLLRRYNLRIRFAYYDTEK